MAELGRPEHEIFARCIARGDSRTLAYASAYPTAKKTKGVWGSIKRLLDRPDVSARIAELKGLVETPAHGLAIERAALSRQWVMQRMMLVAELCLGAEVEFPDPRKPGGVRKMIAPVNQGQAIRALELLGRDLGLFREAKTLHLKPLEEMTIPELEALLGHMSGAVAAAGENDAGGSSGNAEGGSQTTH